MSDVVNIYRNPTFEILGYTQLSVAATTTSIITIPARDVIRITAMVTGYGGNDIASLRFGGTAGAVDSGNNYATAFGEWSSGQNGNQSTLTENNTTSLLRLAASAVTTGRHVVVSLNNRTASRKIALIMQSTEFGAANTTPRRETLGNGIWANTTQQIISVQLLTAGGNTLTAGSGFIVEGANLS